MMQNMVHCLLFSMFVFLKLHFAWAHIWFESTPIVRKYFKTVHQTASPIFMVKSVAEYFTCIPSLYLGLSKAFQLVTDASVSDCGGSELQSDESVLGNLPSSIVTVSVVT